MRRHSGKISSADSGGEQGFWPSYADMMSAVALILFFLMLISYIQNLVTGNDLQNTQEVLALTQSEVKDAEAQLSLLTDQLDDKKKELAAQTLTIEDQSALIAQQDTYIIAANDELVKMRDQMHTIAVFRLSILEKIRDSMSEVMGEAGKVSIGDNGNIILSEGVLFDLGSAEIKADSTGVLDELCEVFYEFLSNEDNLKYVDSIVISGHTDSTGTAYNNRELSNDRALSVINYLLAANGAKLDGYAKYFCAAGYGATRPVQSNDTPEGMAANRRIEISMILKDESVLKIVEEYLAIDLPENEN